MYYARRLANAEIVTYGIHKGPITGLSLFAMVLTYAEYFYEFLSLRSLDKGIMADPTVNVPLLGTVPHKASAECPGGCRNGGFCNERRVCQCPDGFYGPHCEKGKCPQPCRNGGKCIGKSKCKCSKGYQGDLCSKPVCEPGCGTHGTCHEPNQCQCQEGWHGRNCNKKDSFMYAR
ncbi:hypothetical protein GH733_006157 [Mirounga leonina]|nr:hypothetical protein GH733_006157 [Mirounga leonina]